MASSGNGISPVSSWTHGSNTSAVASQIVAYDSGMVGMRCKSKPSSDSSSSCPRPMSRRGGSESNMTQIPTISLDFGASS